MIKHNFPVTKSRMLSASTTPIWQTYVNSGKPLPARVNNRALYGPVLDQGSLGSCSAFASTQWRIALHQLAGFPYEHLSELADYYKERVLNGTVGSDSGATTEEMIQVLEQFGAMDESLDPYDTSKFTQAPPNKWDASLKLQPTQAFYIHASNINDVKDALAQGMPCILAYDCYAEMEGGLIYNTGWLSMPADPTNSIGGHAVNLIGYDDNLQAFLILNQWSDKWGLKQSGLEGCFWMPYTYFTQYAMDVVAGMPDNGAPLKPQPIPAPFTKPQFDTYTGKAWFDKAQYKPNDTIKFSVQVFKNGAPLANEVVGIQVDYDNTDKWDATYTTDANGIASYTFTVDHESDVSGALHYFDPYGDAINIWETVKCAAPVTYPPIETDVVFTAKGVVYNKSTCVPPELWRIVGDAEQVDVNHYRVNDHVYEGAFQNGVTYINWTVMRDAGFKLQGIVGGWRFTK